MTGRRPVAELTKNWSPARLAAVEAEKHALETEAAQLEELGATSPSACQAPVAGADVEE